ncbi:MAG: hypothetical protein M3Y48_04300 [Actinomycetota bacterium]|nr:hypothetical protein [Actinomycetota bacterium]
MTTTSSSTNSDLPAQLRRRRAASWRLPPLASAGLRDPWTDRHADDLNPRELMSWRVAWHHLDLLGLPAIVPEQVVAASRTQRCGTTGRDAA